MIRKEYKENEIFSYVEYSPENMREGLPIVFQLHGAGERGNGQDELPLVDVHGFSKFLKENDRECIFIMPQCPSDTFWTARVESIIKFIEEKIEHYKADKSRARAQGGAGLGLTLCKKIARLHGGKLEIESEIGKGTRVVYHFDTSR